MAHLLQRSRRARNSSCAVNWETSENVWMMQWKFWKWLKHFPTRKYRASFRRLCTNSRFRCVQLESLSRSSQLGIGQTNKTGQPDYYRERRDQTQNRESKINKTSNGFNKTVDTLLCQYLSFVIRTKNSETNVRGFTSLTPPAIGNAMVIICWSLVACVIQ